MTEGSEGPAQVPPPEGPATSSRASRRAEQRRRKRQAQVRGTGAVLAVLLLIAVGFAIYLALDAPEEPPPPAAAGRTQSTLLLQVRGDTGEGVANALIGHDDASGSAAIVLLPPQVLVTVPGAGPEQLGRALATSSADTSRDAVSDLVGVSIDDSWLLTLPALVELVDVLGGIEVEVDAPVVQDQSVLLEPGRQRVDGPRAAAFVTFLGATEQEQTRLARIQEVLDGLLDVLPPTPDELTAVLTGLADGSMSTTSVPELATLLLRVAEADEAGGLQYDVLPVIPIDPGGGVTAFRIDADRVRALVDRLFPSSVPEGSREEGNRVLVLNGVGTPGLGEVVRGRLVPAGFQFAGSRNAPSFGVETTQVLIPEATPEARALGLRVAEALGLPPTSVATQQFGTVADVVVLVGADFQP